MATEELPSEFDVVILGTGLAESVAAAAFSRVGQKVLHLDRRSYYAANWASFTFNALLTWIQQQQEEPQPQEVQDWSSLLEEGEELIYLSQSDSASIRNVQVFCFTSEEDEEEAPDTTEEKDSADPQVETEEEAEEASHKEGEEPEPPQPLPPPAQSQSEPEPPQTLPPPAQSQSEPEPPQTLPPPAQSQSEPEPPQTLPPPAQSQ
ncbi:rab proteins geranylgeranyltransferase component A 1-like, partial [Notothenia coriiceps]|uniref:Rab proteins geranylgeranyltransferase component A 1-like n=1 Tax=Notothenia coriiceps TaxID=8208 RepID=A0A6I9NQ28_9TELE